ncbi:hypothetical protein ACHAXR_007980, partial [Thalassiosira sp. AJA248-18]
ASDTVISPTAPLSSSTVPFVGGKLFINGVAQDAPSDMKLSDVYGCCASTALSADECPEGTDSEHQRLLTPTKIGTMPQMTKEQALQALQSAVTAWNGGSGTWPQMALSERIVAVKKFMSELQHKREDIVQILMYEIGKNRLDAEAEFDRTMQFAEKTIEYINKSKEFGSGWDASNGSTRLFLSRAAIGVVLCLGPYNYPLNETYATLIPALLMGNVAILKLPTVGGLAHLLTIEAFSKALPPGTINFISGSGRTTMPPLMESGKVDSLAFIGGSNAADKLIKGHPEPHRLKLFLQLEAKNMGVYMPDLFESGSDEHMERIMKETIAGTLSYNGQRCTALKLLFVPKGHSEQFANMLAEKVESMSVGLPWESTNSKYSQITPLPNQGRVEYMKALIADAVEKGARIVNKNGGMIVGAGGGGGESTLMIPAVLYPVTPEMRVYNEEQFGPIVPIAPYDSLDEVTKYSREGKYGQQVSIFTSIANEASAQLIDQFSTVFGKININSQCGRSPDTAPFSGRRSSAMGVMSVMNALHEFSIPTVVSYKDVGNNDEIVKGIGGHSKFLQSTS